MTSETDEKMGKKVGVYVCYCGGNISDHVDVEKVAQNIKDVPGVTVTRTNMFMCSDPGQELIMEDIRNGIVDRVVVASCAPSLHELTFRGAIKRAGMNPYLYEHANIREQVSWVHHGDAATQKAMYLISAAVSKAKHLKSLDPIRVNATKHTTVIGGGIAGLRAARDLSLCGMKVLLVEKSPVLGGQAANLNRLVPTNEKSGELLQQLADQVLKDPNIQVLTCAQVTKVEGYVGNFKVTLTRSAPKSDEDLAKLDRIAKSKVKLAEFSPFAGIYPMQIPESTETSVQETGAIIMATGFKTYVPHTGEYGYGEFSEVVTLPEFIRLMAENTSRGKILEINGKRIRRVGFIHCVGSRQIPGIHQESPDGRLNEYCSRVCCTATLHAANEIREAYPETEVFDFYRDIRTYGRGHEHYYDKASENRVVFFRFEPEESPKVERCSGSAYPLKVQVVDHLTFGEEVEAELDLLVLAVGMEPTNISELTEMMKLPLGPDRFLQEVHPKLRPVEMANAGIFLAGTCQAPMDISESCAAAQAASVKTSGLLSKGYVELDPFVAEVDIQKCKGHGNCITECPEQAIEQVEMDAGGKKVMMSRVNPALCTGCGMCVAVCPENAIEVNGWTLKQYEAMVDAITQSIPTLQTPEE